MQKPKHTKKTEPNATHWPTENDLRQMQERPYTTATKRLEKALFKDKQDKINLSITIYNGIIILAAVMMITLMAYETSKLWTDINKPDMKVTYTPSYNYTNTWGSGSIPEKIECEINNPDNHKYNYCILATKKLLIIKE